MSRPVDAEVIDMKFLSGSDSEVSKAPSGLNRSDDDEAFGLPHAGVLVTLVDSARNSTFTLSVILKSLKTAGLKRQ